MKPFQLLPQLALVIAVVYACSDSMSPATAPSSLSVPGNPALRGESPPPPVETAITVCTSVCGEYSGTYFSNGSSSASVAAATEIGDPSLTFSGMAWLKLDNHQPISGLEVSANARFKVVDDNPPTGTGKFTIFGEEFTITEVLTFVPLGDCAVLGQPCANITFKYKDAAGVEHDDGFANADNCTFVPPEGSGSGGGFDCGDFGE